MIGCFGLTEPTAGIDPASLATTAVQDGAGWVLTGTKRWIGLASIADVAIIWAKTDDGIRGFVVPTTTDRFIATPIQPKLSMRASVQCDITLDGVREALLSGEDAEPRHHWAMQSRLVVSDAPVRMYVVVFDTGDEVVSGLKSFADDHAISAASLTGIGACQEATVAFFDATKKRYASIPVREQVEVLVLTGNVIRNPKSGSHVHAHVVLGRRDGSASGGHLQHAIVRPTVEVVLTELPADLRRTFDANTGLASIDLHM